MFCCLGGSASYLFVHSEGGTCLFTKVNITDLPLWPCRQLLFFMFNVIISAARLLNFLVLRKKCGMHVDAPPKQGDKCHPVPPSGDARLPKV